MEVLLIALTTALRFLFKRGPLYWLIWFFTYVYLRISRRVSGRRLDLYDFTAAGEPEKLGFFIPQQEWILESPQSASHLEKNCDDVFCVGVNSHSESLVAHISRQADGKIHCSLSLRLANGCKYTLPPEHSIQTETTEPHIFGSSRIKMECLLPMRKWRVFFNGILRETSGDQEDQNLRYRHVKFSFIWTASSDAFDYTCDMPHRSCADIVAKFSSWKHPPPLLLRRLKEIFHDYEQSGMLLGTVTLENEPEKEVYLWGNRGHNMGSITKYQEYQALDVLVNTENGTFVHLGILEVPGFIYDVPYGYVMKANGFIHPVESCKLLTTDIPENEIHLVCISDGQKYTLKLTELPRSKFDDAFNIDTSMSEVVGCVNTMLGRGLIFRSKVKRDSKAHVKAKEHLDSVQKNVQPEFIPLSIPFDDPWCQLVSISGGKGASLAKLAVLSEELKSFAVPKGLVVTTSAYKDFTDGILDASLKKLQSVTWKQDPVKEDVISACERVMETMIKAQLPKSVEQSIERSLYAVFGKEIDKIRFAVRSSTCGEDTEQMSAAGQMETFLGLNGITQVLVAVRKCWASQFSFTAVEYNRRYGQQLNTPMAVVIQEMVPCEVAGVAFTCDPVTGNPSYITITSNYGLGESVVSASAEPDTIILRRDINNKLQIHSKTAGIKQTKIIMDEFGGTSEVNLDQEKSVEYSISEGTALALGDITVKIEEKFGAPRDIEWGVLNGEIFLFQARPVTTIDGQTEFEAMHMFDTYLRREDEFLTTANVGEVMPGAMSPLGMDFFAVFPLSYARHKYVNWEGEALPRVPYFAKRMIHAYNHIFIAVSDGFFIFSEGGDGEISNHAKALSVSIFGRVVTDKKYFEVAKDRHASEKRQGTSIIGRIYITLYMFFAAHFTKKVKKIIDKFRIPTKKNSSAREILRTISQHYDKIVIAITNHLDCSLTSPYWNLSLLTLLSTAHGAWDNDVYRDFGYLLSALKQVESADIPCAIQRLGGIISQHIDSGKFKKMNVDEALKWLQTTSSKAGDEFRNFLARHGHRCLKEADIFSKTWEMDPGPLVKTLQGVVTGKSEVPEKKQRNSFEKLISNMHVKLNFFQRLQLRLLVPNCQRGVREREACKTVLIKGFDRGRAAFWDLADAMVREGRLPNKDLLFFLCVEEIRQLINTRSPKLVARALRRWKCHPEMDKYKFPEMISGVQKPVNMNEELDISADGFCMTGVPVSQGVVKGTARVVVNIEDAPNIQYGDILIAYSTDTAWSPYFPMLSGVATELGGLISHGAVIAREYGLPCVVGLRGASRAFKSGDLVLLDGNRGILKKMESL